MIDRDRVDERTMDKDRDIILEKTIKRDRDKSSERTMVRDRDTLCEGTTLYDRAKTPERATTQERTWFDVWQAKRIAARSNRQFFNRIKLFSEIASFGERTKETERDTWIERTIGRDSSHDR